MIFIWLLAFATALVASIAACAIARRLALRSGFTSARGTSRIGPGGVPLLGGLAVLAGIACGIILAAAVGGIGPAAALLPAFIMLAIAFAAIGLCDDRRGLPVWMRAGGEIVIALVVAAIWSGSLARAMTGLATLSLVIIAAFFATAGANLFNMTDNADGIAAGTGALSFAGLGVLALSLGSAGTVKFPALLLVCAAGALVGFVYWNLPPARIYLGDAGTLPLGAWLALAWLSLGAACLRAPGPALAVRWICLALIAGYTLFDPLYAIVSRLLRGRAPWTGGVDHPTHRLAARVKSARTVWLVIMAAHLISVVIGIGVMRGVIAPAAVAVALGAWIIILAAARPTHAEEAR